MCKNNGHAMFGLGTTLVVLGSLSAILGIAAAAAFPLDVYSRTSGPIWAGIFVVITGIMGMMAGRNFNREGASTGFVVAFLTLSIIAIIATLIQVGLSGTGTTFSCLSAELVSSLENIFSDDETDVDLDQSTTNLYCVSAVAVHYTCLVLGLLEMVLCFVSSIFGCIVGCTCCAPQPGPSVVVMQPSTVPYAQMPNTPGNPVGYPQSAYLQQPGGPPPAYLPPPAQLVQPYPGGGPIAMPAGQPPAEKGPTVQAGVTAQPV